MNIKFNERLLSLTIIGLLAGHAIALEIITPPEMKTTSFQIIDPDRHIKTLGKVTFKIDLSASHDDLLALKVRRSSLKLKDERSFTSFGVHKDAGIIIIAGGGVNHVSIASINSSNGSQTASVLFYGSDNNVISPKPKDVAVFDNNFDPLEFTYTPLQAPGSLIIPVSIALDASGSMSGYMDKVIKATQDFMRELPEFTHCQLLSFNDDVSMMSSGHKSCPSSAYLLNKSIKAEGMTALHKAIKTGFRYKSHRIDKSFPNISIIITDGKNTANSSDTISSLITIKGKSNSKLFVFWAGSYQKGYLQGLADLEFVSTDNLGAELENFFNSLGVSLSGMQTLHIRK